MTPASIPAIVLGGSGYVAGELLRLLAAHPHFKLAGVLSDSQPGESVAKVFPHLASCWPDTRFLSQSQIENLMRELPRPAVFCAAPHGAAAALIDSLLRVAGAAGHAPRVVDISADYRYASAQAYEQVYQHAHGAPQRLREFTCALPEHLERAPTAHVAHPGCFATAILLSAVPLLKLGLASPAVPGPGANPSKAPTIPCATVICTRTTRSPTGIRRKSSPAPWRPPASRRTSRSCRIPDPLPAAST